MFVESWALVSSFLRNHHQLLMNFLHHFIILALRDTSEVHRFSRFCQSSKYGLGFSAVGWNVSTFNRTFWAVYSCKLREARIKVILTESDWRAVVRVSSSSSLANTELIPNQFCQNFITSLRFHRIQSQISHVTLSSLRRWFCFMFYNFKIFFTWTLNSKLNADYRVCDSDDKWNKVREWIWVIICDTSTWDSIIIDRKWKLISFQKCRMKSDWLARAHMNWNSIPHQNRINFRAHFDMMC